VKRIESSKKWFEKKSVSRGGKRLLWTQNNAEKLSRQAFALHASKLNILSLFTFTPFRFISSSSFKHVFRVKNRSIHRNNNKIFFFFSHSFACTARTFECRRRQWLSSSSSNSGKKRHYVICTNIFEL
jgi:hypothetical protein